MSDISFEMCFDNKSKEEKEEDEKTYKKYIDFTSTLPTNEVGGIDKIVQYQGFWYGTIRLPYIMAVQNHFKPRPSDILVASTPKCGTTWLKSIIFSVANRKLYPPSNQNHPLLKFNPHFLVPALEFDLFINDQIPNLDVLPPPRLLGTHIPYTSLSPSIIDSGCPIIYICRDPKDAFLSYYHFRNNFLFKNTKTPKTLEEVFEIFCEGLNLFGPFWDHVLGYWKAKIERPESILFLQYEKLKAEPVLQLKRVAEFMKFPFSLEEERSGLLEEILRLCSFETLSNLEVNKSGKMLSGAVNKAFFRKGRVGDGKVELTSEMIHRLDQITKQKFHGYNLVL